jgi:hypothetical protein
MNAEFEDLLGKTLVRVEREGDDLLRFVTNEGEKFEMFHQQDCCESVEIESITGDLTDLIGTPILLAEEAEGGLPPKDPGDESYEWTFYKLRTIKGSVDIRWYGTSNGYYSETVDFIKVT